MWESQPKATFREADLSGAIRDLHRSCGDFLEASQRSTWVIGCNRASVVEFSRTDYPEAITTPLPSLIPGVLVSAPLLSHWQHCCIVLTVCGSASGQVEAVKKIRIIVVDDNPLFLDTVVSFLAVEFEIVATATDGESVLDLVRTHAPDLVLLDLAMPKRNGIQVTERLADDPFSPPVVICSVESDPEIVKAAIEAGAAAYVHKSRIATDLISAMKAAVQGSVRKLRQT